MSSAIRFLSVAQLAAPVTTELVSMSIIFPGRLDELEDVESEDSDEPAAVTGADTLAGEGTLVGLLFSARPQLPQNLLTSTVPQSTQKGMLRAGESELGCRCQGTTGLGRRGEGVSSVVDTGLQEK